jgi:hypothetical protein
MGLFQDAAQGANGQFTVQRHRASDFASDRLAFQYHMTATVSGNRESHPFQRADRLYP